MSQHMCIGRYIYIDICHYMSEGNYRNVITMSLEWWLVRGVILKGDNFRLVRRYTSPRCQVCSVVSILVPNGFESCGFVREHMVVERSRFGALKVWTFWGSNPILCSQLLYIMKTVKAKTVLSNIKVTGWKHWSILLFKCIIESCLHRA